MTLLTNDRLLRAIQHEPVDKTPIWIMRQAGRYLPEYQEVRKQAGSFLTLCKTPELACEVSLQPLRRFALDAAIVFSDILMIPDAMGLKLGFQEGEGPFFERPLRCERDIEKLIIPEPDVHLNFTLETIRLIQRELQGKVPLIGFCGSPWTLAAYIIEGHGKSSFALIQAVLKQREPWLYLLLDKLAQAVSLHLNAQIQAGAQVVMLFDTWGSLLDSADYREFSLRFIQHVMANLLRYHQGRYIPVILYTRGRQPQLMMESGCDVLSVDEHVHLQEARQYVNGRVALQGNMHPDFLRQSPEVIREKVRTILQEYGSGSGHIFNLSQGITPDIAPEHVAVLVDAVHELSAV